MLEETFSVFRSCGANLRECKVYWLSPWDNQQQLIEVVHPRHQSSRYGLAVESHWITTFWNDLVDRSLGVRVQVHTHPEEAFHSATDDAYPLLCDAGFLSLVIPDFATGPVGFRRAFLTEIQPDGRWRQVAIGERIMIDE